MLLDWPWTMERGSTSRFRKKCWSFMVDNKMSVVSFDLISELLVEKTGGDFTGRYALLPQESPKTILFT